MIKLKYTILLIVSLVFLGLTSCKDDDDQIEPTYEIPTTYNFENVDYDGQKQRIAQFLELKSYMSSANNGASLDEERLLAMYSNDASKAAWSGTYDASKQMRDKTLSAVQPVFDDLLKDLAQASESTQPGSNGTAGVVSSADKSKSYLLNSNGSEVAQVFEKALIGALLYYQICEVYTGAEKMNVDNTTVVAGQGTKMEHHWDEAFGYFGVPMDFPQNIDNTSFLGTYSIRRDALMNTNTEIMNAYLKGRAAISNKDMEGRDQAIPELRKALEQVPAGSAIHYLNSAISNFDDMALRAHALSEAAGFIYSLQFNATGKADQTQVNNLLTLIGGNADLRLLNFYATEKAKIEQARDQLSDLMGLGSIKSEL